MSNEKNKKFVNPQRTLATTPDGRPVSQVPAQKVARRRIHRVLLEHRKSEPQIENQI